MISFIPAHVLSGQCQCPSKPVCFGISSDTWRTSEEQQLHKPLQADLPAGA